MNCRDITFYLDERWCNALETRTGKTMEALLAEQVDLLIQQLPQEQQDRITQEIQCEDADRERQFEAARRFSLTKITENGESRYLFLERGEIMFQTALRLRRYLRGELPDSAQFYGDAVPITQDEMEQYTAEMVCFSPRVVGIYDINLDAGKVYSLDCDSGWQGYQIKDVSTAVYFATKRESDDWIAKRSRFNQQLAEKELPNVDRPIHVRAAKPFPPELFSFYDDICKVGHLLNFCVPLCFCPDQVYGINAKTGEAIDHLNLYANYDMERGCVCDTLEVYLVRGDGSELECEYRLTPEEQAALCSKMNSYCMVQMGIPLEKAREQYLAEEQRPGGQEPSQQIDPTLQM